MEMLSQEFVRPLDRWRANGGYGLADVLHSAFAMFSLKSPSPLSFREQAEQEPIYAQASNNSGSGRKRRDISLHLRSKYYTYNNFLHGAEKFTEGFHFLRNINSVKFCS
jgi:hypothetical protein